MADFYDISTWSEKLYFQPGGTRNKVVVENPESNELYFFKTSLLREQKDYKYEFWSEILASEIGGFLGFDMLRYDIAFNRGEIGCISKSMNTEGKNKLTEGMSYLTGFDTTYNPEDKSSKTQYTFQLINESLKYFRLGHFIDKIIEIIILDSIIGNGDRHQENWGIITEYNEIIKKVEDIIAKQDKSFGEKLLFSIFAITSKAKKENMVDVAKTLHLLMPGQFSQIYDSGSCLGREVEDEKIPQMLKDSSRLEAYIRRGVSEIHWEGEKLKHFELIKKLKVEFYSTVFDRIKTVKQKCNFEQIEKIVFDIDNQLPVHLKVYKLPDERKEFITKLITLRLGKLFEILG